MVTKIKIQRFEHVAGALFLGLRRRACVHMAEHEAPQFKHCIMDFIVHADFVFALAVVDHGGYQRVNTLTVGFTERLAQRMRDILAAHQPTADGVIDIVVDVGNPVGKVNDAPLGRRGVCAAGVADNPIAYFGGQVERFNAVYNPQALFVVAKSVWADFVQRGFPA